METTAHQHLKRLALAHLRMLGCQALATEVRCPISRYRIDVAGYKDGEPTGAATIAIECKQSRSDFLRDCEQIEPLLELRSHYEGIRQSIQEHRIKTLEPQLRCNGTSLFPELDEWDFSSSNLQGYRKVMRELRRIDEKLHGETKFFLMAKYHLADQLYLAAPCGVIRSRETPPGWGLLEWNEKGGDQLTIAFNAPCKSPKPKHRERLLRNIAVAASRHVSINPSH